jgi:hypothetical protein
MSTLIDFMEASLARQETGERGDAPRLTKQLEAVRRVMEGGEWWTLEQLAEQANCTTQSASARVRDLRKVKFGAHCIERKGVPGKRGLFLYRMAN